MNPNVYVNFMSIRFFLYTLLTLDDWLNILNDLRLNNGHWLNYRLNDWLYHRLKDWLDYWLHLAWRRLHHHRIHLVWRLHRIHLWQRQWYRWTLHCFLIRWCTRCYVLHLDDNLDSFEISTEKEWILQNGFLKNN